MSAMCPDHVLGEGYGFEVLDVDSYLIDQGMVMRNGAAAASLRAPPAP